MLEDGSSNSALIESSETFKDLGRWRLAKSREKGVPAFIVAHDGMLRDITVYLPRDECDENDQGGRG